MPKASPDCSLMRDVNSSPVLPQDGNEVRGSSSHVQEHGQLKAGCQLKVPLEPLLLSLLVTKLQSAQATDPLVLFPKI